MLAYDNVTEFEVNRMQQLPDALLFEKVQWELLNEDGESITIPEYIYALFIEQFVLSIL